MTAPNFNNLDELKVYLTDQDQRIHDLEQANIELVSEIKKRFIARDELPAISENDLPKTGLLSHRFLARAFTVWGHYFVAQLLISVPIFIILVLAFSSFFINMLRITFPGI
jgi:hypothetical protein